MIAVISDSHIPDRASEIPEQFHQRLKQADKTVHCGDFETQEENQELKRKYGILGVKGNCDYFDIPVSQEFEEGEVKFGVYHGAGITPRGDHPTLSQTAEKLGVDVLLTGHTHQSEISEHGGKVIINPGSCTGVGGGSAQPSNPKMMTIKVQKNRLLKIRLAEKNTQKGNIAVQNREITVYRD